MKCRDSIRNPTRIALAKAHFDRAMALGGGHQAGPLVAYAESVLVAQKDKTGFQNMLRQALRVDINKSPENRELNLADAAARAMAVDPDGQAVSASEIKR